jgi:L-malate glycosyltransferase
MTNRAPVHYHQVLPSAELGGGNLVALELAAFLRERGECTSIWVPGEGTTLERARRMGLATEVFNGPGLFRGGLLRPLLANWRLARRLRRQAPGVVHVHSSFSYGSMSWGLRRSGLPRVMHVQLEGGSDGLRWALQRPPELIVTCARFLVEHVRGCLPEPLRERQWIEPVPNAVDTGRFFPGDQAEAKARVGTPAGRPLLLMLANLAPHKGQETAIRAVAELKRRGVAVDCWLAGEERGGGDYYTGQLRELIRELGVTDRVELLGYRDDAAALLRAADYFLLPSTNEGLPLTVLEAQATKVPVLASATAGIPEVIEDGETGFLIEPTNAVAYADRIEALLRDAGQRERITERAFARTTREHNWEAYCGRIGDLYQELLARCGQPVDRAGPAERAAQPSLR